MSSDFGLFSVVSTRNYSLTIVPYSQLVTQKIGLESPVALIKVWRIRYFRLPFTE